MRRLGVSLEPAGVAAVVSVAGAHCGKGDEEAVASLRPDVRRRWLAEHSLSPGVRYYSVVNTARRGQHPGGPP